jgi:hypothetical protein
MKFKRRSDSPLKKRARHGFRGYPVATIAFYGPNDTHATKVAVGILTAEGADPDTLGRWVVEDGDVRTDPAVSDEILELIHRYGAKSVVMTDQIIGCPHEAGVDYPEGGVCPQCPFWAHRDRWTGEVVH